MGDGVGRRVWGSEVCVDHLCLKRERRGGAWDIGRGYSIYKKRGEVGINDACLFEPFWDTPPGCQSQLKKLVCKCLFYFLMNTV